MTQPAVSPSPWTSFTRMTGKLVRRALMAICLAALLTPAVALAQGQLLVYAIVQEQDAELLTRLFREATGVDVQFVRAAGGEIVSRVIAEARSPQADVVLGGASNLHISMALEGVLEAYRSAEADYLPEFARDEDGYWSGFYLTALGVGVNVDRYRELYGDKPLPVTWEDLADPAFAGEIVLTDPVSSSTSYLFVQTLLQQLGWDAGWEYLERLVPLVGQFPTSGAAPPRMVGTGEYAMGVAFVHSLSRNIEQGFPVTLIVPPNTGGEVGAVSLIKGGPNPDNARRFVDFILGVEAQQAYTDLSLTTPLHPDVVLPAAAISRDAIQMFNYDPALAGEQREETLAKWAEIVD